MKKLLVALAALFFVGAATVATVGLPVAMTNDALKKLPGDPTIAPFPILRLGIDSVLDVPISWWKQQLGNCASHGMTSDVGSCNDTYDGNSVYAVYGADGADVRQWRAKCNNAGDDTAAINAAFASNVSPILFPTGSCAVTNLNAPPVNKKIRGQNEATSLLVTSSATGDVLPLSNGGVRIERLGFSSYVTRTSGCYFHIMANEVFVDHFYTNAAYCAFQVDDGLAIDSVDNGIITNNLGSTQDVVKYGSGTGVQSVAQYFGHTVISSGVTNQNNITLVNVGDLFLDYIQSLDGTRDLYIAPNTGQAVLSLKTNGSYFDHGATNLSIGPGGSGVVQRLQFDNTWFGSGTVNGAVLDGGTGSASIDGIQFTNCQFVLSGGTGLLVQNRTRNVTVSSSLIASNVNGIEDNRSSGFNVFSVTNSIVGSGGGLGGNTNGILAQGAGDYLNLNNNNLLGNNANSLVYTNTGTHNVVENNAGYNPTGNTVPTVGASPWTYTNGPTPSTIYIFGGTVSSIAVNGVSLINAANNPWIIPLAANDTVTTTYSVVPIVHVFTQ